MDYFYDDDMDYFYEDGIIFAEKRKSVEEILEEYFEYKDPDWDRLQYGLDEETINEMIEEERRRVFDETRNIKRDKRGRLNKGAKLAHRDTCDNEKICRLYEQGYTVKKIANVSWCSKGTVYRVIKVYKEKKLTSTVEKNTSEEDIEISLMEEKQRRVFDEERNIKRDKRGRLNKGAKLAYKDACNKDRIWLDYCSGIPVKEIVKIRDCSKSTVYNVIKEYKERETASNMEQQRRIADVEISVEIWDKFMDRFL